MNVIFVRHGKDDDRYRGGWSSLDLINEGVEQAKQLAKHLKDNNHTYQIAHIISSDLTRTLTTANIISQELCLPVQRECQIRETNNGDLAGMLNETALKQYPGLFFRSLEMDEAYPNGESPKDFYLRIKKWFSDFTSYCHNAKGNVLVVTHSGVINSNLSNSFYGGCIFLTEGCSSNATLMQPYETVSLLSTVTISPRNYGYVVSCFSSA